jgi:protein-L-isoaspartate(D-aspartate) O-methyltransferase
MNASASSEIYADRRRRMIDSQLRPSGVNDLALLAAFAEVPREPFVEPSFAALAYADSDAPALKGGGRLLLAPATLGRLIEGADVRPGERVLDVAGGSGYGASVLSRLGARVVALETAEAGQGARDLLAGQERVELAVGDLVAGASAKAPFDIILVNGAFEVSPELLIGQLADGGRLVGLDASFPAPKAVLIERVGGAISRRTLFDAAGPRLDGFRQRPGFAF